MRKIIPVCILGLMFCLGICCNRTEAQGAARIIELKVNRPYLKYDVTGNGKVDRIEVSSKTKKSNNTMRIRINGKLVYKDSQFEGYAVVKLIRMKKKQSLFCVAHLGNDDAGPRAVYSYKGRRWKRLLKLTNSEAEAVYDTIAGDVDSATSGTLTVRYRDLNMMIGATEYELVYQYKNNKLTLKNPVTDLYIMKLGSTAYKKNAHLFARQSLPVYETTDGTGEPAFTIQAGIDVAFAKICRVGIRPWFQVIVGDKTGWIPGMEYQQMDDGTGYYFDDVLMYG